MEFEMKNSMYRARKAGVSLIAVLLFMLVATIAATATYKWLTSEGRSSGTRLQKQEAFQSSMAGIENVRAWMTFNANDVGALIKQYKDTGKKIKLNDRLAPWARANQSYDVWLAGVNTGTSHNFKLKILSSGKSRGSAVHNEIAIFNVDGLYRVQIPEVDGSLNYDEAFAGASDGLTNTDTMQSGIIHGDFKDQNNTPTLTQDFIISGNAAFGGELHAFGDLYVKGSITSTNGGYIFGNDLPGADTNVVYIGGDVNCADNQPLKVYGDLHVDGKILGKCAIEVSGNLTIGGAIVRDNPGTKKFTIGKNLVFKQDAVFNWVGNNEVSENSYGTGGDFGTGVGGKSYLANISGKNEKGKRKINLGSEIYLYESFPTTIKFCQNACDNAAHDLTCGVASRCPNGYCEGFFSQCHQPAGTTYNVGNPADRYFSFKADENGKVKNTPRIHEWAKTDNVLKNIGDKYWEHISKMNAYGKIIKADGTIPQELLLKNETSWKTKATQNNTYCGIAKNWLWDDASVQKLNDCYAKAKTEDKLYNGFLPIEWQYNRDQEPKTKKLDGRFVIYASTPVGDTYLPATESNAIVMFYFEKGANGQLKGRHKEHLDWVYNYFIYSDDDIKELNDFHIMGSVFLSEGKKMKKFQGDNRLDFKEEVVRALVTAGFIMENPEFTQLATGGSASSGSDIAAAGGHDDYFVAAAPQLKITLETQYENNEPLPAASEEEELNPSFIILPRVIYLPSDPYGKLENYINLVNLNGSTKTKNMAKVGGCTGIPKMTLLYDRANPSTASKLPMGLHECNYSDDGQSIPFYIYVTDEEMGSKPWVHLETSYKEMGANSTEYVKLACEVGSGEQFKVKVSKPTDLPSSWLIAPVATHEGACDDASSSCTFTINANETDCGTLKSLFRVTTDGAEYGTANFAITECVGCRIEAPNQESLVMSSLFRVNRQGLMQYCVGPGAGTSECETNGTYYQMMQASWPDCEVEDDKSWVAAVGFNSPITNNCSVYDNNESWNCGISSDLKLTALPSGVPVGCEAVIPPEDKNYLPKASLTSGEEAPLYAQLKARKARIHVRFEGENLHAKTLYATSTRFPADRSCMYSDAGCDFELFTGDDFHLTVSNGDKADFSYWTCDPATSVNCPLDASSSTITGQTFSIEHVSGDNEIVAWFGQNDKHCFFDEFLTSRECTGVGEDWKYCFNYCSDADECRIGNGALTNQAKWLVMGNEAQKNKLQYEDGKIWLDRLYNRDKKQTEYSAVKVLSTVQAGPYGTMRAQFQVPQLGRGDNDASANVNRSGFILRSNNDASSYLLLSIFANREGKLAAKACVGSSCVSENLLNTAGIGGPGMGGPGMGGPGMGGPAMTMGSISSTDIVTMSAELRKQGANDILLVTVMKGQLGSYAMAKATIILSDIEGYASLEGHEYVGFSLADSDFKLYDVGWKSETYNAECWDTYPTIKCSFSAAYLGGIVPQNQKVKPWIGLSSWFDEKGCNPEYYYNGEDATCMASSMAGYQRCMTDYKFKEGGIHGTIENGVETKMAKVKIGQCYQTSLSMTDLGLLRAEEALCGQFWVGEISVCRKNFMFFNDGYGRSLTPYSTGSLSSDDIFALEANQFANLRSASISISMDNPNGEELEVYLRSESGYYNSLPKFSASAVTKAHHSALISVEELATSSGFDPEKVTAVIIRNHGGSNVTIKEVKSVCDNVTSIQCKDAVYSGGKFKVNVVVKHHEGVGSYEITATENGSTVTDLKKEYTCQGNGLLPGLGCRVPDLTGRIAFDTDPYNPYANGSSAEKTYVFTVNALDADGNPIENAPCTTPQLTLRPIQGECRWRGDASSVEVRPGTGLPDFQYRLSDCGGGNCKWVISLDNASDIYSGTGTTQGGFSSLPTDKRNAFNTGANSFTVGSVHKIYFKNAAGATTEFAECYKEFTVTGGTSSGTVQSSSSVGPASSAVTSSSSSAVPGMITVTCPSRVETYPVKRTSWGITTSGESTLGNNETLVRDLYIGNTLISSKNCSRNDCQAMDDAYITKAPGTYVYSVKIGSQEMCRGSLVVNNPIVCSAKPDDITLGENFTLKASKASDAEGNPKDCKLTGNGVSGGDCYYGQSQFGSDITVTPTSAGTHHYKYEVKLENNNSTTETFKCEWDVKVAAPASSSSGGDMCSTTNIVEINTANQQNIGTSAVCYKVKINHINECNYSNFNKRQIRFNGGNWSTTADGTNTTVNADADAQGYIWIDIKSGGYSYSGLSCW